MLKSASEIRPYDPDDLRFILADPRPADYAEVMATGPGSFERQMYNSVGLSAAMWTGCIDEVPVCVFGVHPVSYLHGIGAPWMIGSTLLDEGPRHLLQLSPMVIVMMLAKFSRLVNWVHADNTRSIRWLQWLGFKLDTPVPHGHRGELFHRFSMEERACAYQP